MEARKPSGDLRDMPALYFERTDGAEQRRHRKKLEQLGEAGGLLIDAIEDADGGWHVELVTMDWDEPGLLDRIFEAILRCIDIPDGIAIKRARIFTGDKGQVVNILELTTRAGGPVKREHAEQVLSYLREIQPGERGVLESIEHIPFTKLIPLVTSFPTLDNERSEHYTFLQLKVAKVSNRFTSILLHFLARSELWLNIQIAEIRQESGGVYEFYVVDKYGRKLRDSHFTRLSIVRVLEAMNRVLLRFNVYYLRRDWNARIERNEHTIFHSRPHPGDFLQDLVNVRQMAQLKGFEPRLSNLVNHGLLSSRAFYFLKKVEAFVSLHAERIGGLAEIPPGPGDTALCREYFGLRLRALRILNPLFEKLTEMPPAASRLSDQERLRAMAHPIPIGPYAYGAAHELYHPGSIWLAEPARALEPFLLMARTDCYFRDDFLETLDAAMEGWTPEYISANAAVLGAKFMTVLDESIRQSNTATLLRSLRSVGMLRRYLPGFARIEGLVHVIVDHTYTVDEHTFVVVEALQGLRLLAEVLPAEVLPGHGRLLMRKEFEHLGGARELQRFAEKYVIELRMLQRVTEMRRNPAIKPFFLLMEEVRRNTLEYLVEMNLLDQGHSLCMTALAEIEKIRQQLGPLVRHYNSLPFAEQRNLVLAGLLHDLKKPAKDHGPLMARELDETLSAMGLEWPEKDVARVAWLVEHHLDIRPLMKRMGEEGEGALLDFAKNAGDPSLVDSLILFTYADRVALSLETNKNSHDAMVLSSMLTTLAESAAA